jgi:nicotinamidase-related amidase
MKPALLIIDAQNEYFAPHGQWVLPEGERALECIQALLAAARARELPIFHITHESLEADSPVFRAGTVGIEIHPALEVRPSETRIVKHEPGAFTETPLASYLRLPGVDTIIVSGYMTHMCCDTTTRQASERGIAVLFAEDATATRDLRLHGETVPYVAIQRATLAVMAEFARVLPTERVIAALGAEGEN